MMKEYTFEEVIASIKEGETYKCTDDFYCLKTINNDDIGLKFNKESALVIYPTGVNSMQRFVKVEKPVDFEEARKEYRDNKKTIKSCVSERILKNGIDTEIGFSEIEGQWIVLD